MPTATNRAERPRPRPANALALAPLAALLAVAALASPALAATLQVPGDAPTIQGAIVLAQPGDVVLVAAGTWNEQIDFLGKAITVRSADGPALTTIDALGAGTVVTFASGEGAGSVLEGFTITGGAQLDFDLDAGGGGILVHGASPSIRGNRIEENLAAWNGAGILCVDSNALIEGNTFQENSFQSFISDAPFGNGGGIQVRGGAVTLVDNVFDSNAGADRGGAIHFRDTLGSTATGTICVGNASGVGGAIAIDGTSDVVIENLIAVGNFAYGHVSLIGPSEGLGGGIFIDGNSVAVVRNATIVGNTAFPGWNGTGSGGGVFATSSLLTVPTLVTNSIVRGNVAGTDAEIQPSVAVTYSDIEGGFVGTGNFDADPLFVVGPLGAYYLSQIAAGQVSQSPCVDAGDPLSTPLPGTTTRTDEVADSGVIDVGYHFRGADPIFRRGDCNGDGLSNIADPIFLLSVLFPLPPTPTPAIGCADACDGNDDGAVNIADAVALLAALFGGVPVPPPVSPCGTDPVPDLLDCALPPPC